MGKDRFDIYKVIRNIDRSIFVSEADFKFCLAHSIKALYEDANVICEFTPSCEMANIEYIKGDEQEDEYKSIRHGRRIHIDILVDYEGKLIPIELKYRTAKASIFINNFCICLTNHIARDAGCYGFIRVILRIADYIDKEKCEFGYVVFLTNDSKYQGNPPEKCRYEELWINNLSFDTNSEKKINLHFEGRVDGQNKKLSLDTDCLIMLEEWEIFKDKGLFYKVAQILRKKT